MRVLGCCWKHTRLKKTHVAQCIQRRLSRASNGWEREPSGQEKTGKKKNPLICRKKRIDRHKEARGDFPTSALGGPKTGRSHDKTRGTLGEERVEKKERFGT